MHKNALSRTLLRPLLLGALIFAGARGAAAWPVTVAWDPNPPEELVVAYSIHYGRVSRSAVGFAGYEAQVDVGSGTRWTLDLPVAGGRYYLAVTAWNQFGARSDFSAELEVLDPGAAPAGVLVAGVDLVEASVTDPPAVVLRGGSFQLTDTTRNQGAAATGKPTTARFYLSADRLKSTADRLLTGSRPVPALAPGASSSGAVTVTVQTTTTLGTYYVLACADDLNGVTESSETNNCTASARTVAVTQPDLVESAVGASPGSVSPGGGLAVVDTVRNQGGAASGASTTRYYLSSDTVKSSSDRVLAATRAVASLGPGGASSGSLAVTVPAATAAGRYYVLACADDLGTVPESSEVNNCAASAATIGVTMPDLVEDSVSSPPPALLVGASFAATDVVRNQGLVTAGASTTRYYLSLDRAKSTSDRLLSGTRSVLSLPAGATSSGGAAVAIPSGTEPGTYYVLACADDLSKVSEGVESNNCRASAATVTVTSPDLAETFVSAPSSAVVGVAFAVTDTLVNRGTEPTGAAATTRYYLSADTAKSSTDHLLTGTRVVASPLAAGGTSSGSATLTVPAGTYTGPYYLLACADNLAKVPESIETNNCIASLNTLTVRGPDVVESAVSLPPVSAAIGSSFSVTDTVVNQGSVSDAKTTTTRYYLSTDALKGSTDKLLTGTRSVVPLAPGGRSQGTAVVTIPTTTLVGTYYLLTCADNTSVLPESNETNNCAISAALVLITP